MIILTQKQCVLFFYSEYSKNFDTLRNFILKKGLKPTIKTEDLPEFSKEDRDLVLNRFDELLDLAKQEWKTASSILNEKEKKIECELCGHKPLKDHFKIYNTINGKELIVGSSCIKTYNFMSPSGKDIKQIIHEQEAQTALIRNQNKVFEINHSIISDMKRFENLKRECEFLTNNLDAMVENCKGYYKKYDKLIRKKSALNDKNLQDIIQYHRKIHNVLAEIDEFIKFSECNKYGISNKVWKWCDEYDKDLFTCLKYNGRIDRRTVGRIKEPKFLNKFMNLMKPLLIRNDIKIIKMKGAATQIKCLQLENIILDLDSSEFLKNYKEYIFDKENFHIHTSEILQLSKISDEKSLDVALNILHKKFINHFYIRFSDNNINEIAFKKIQTGEIFNVEYKRFINRFLAWIDLEKSNCSKGMLTEIEVYIQNFTLSTYKNDEEYMEHLELYNITKGEFYNHNDYNDYFD